MAASHACITLVCSVHRSFSPATGDHNCIARLWLICYPSLILDAHTFIKRSGSEMYSVLLGATSGTAHSSFFYGDSRQFVQSVCTTRPRHPRASPARQLSCEYACIKDNVKNPAAAAAAAVPTGAAIVALARLCRSGDP